MTLDEAKRMAEAKLKCMERDVSGKDDDCNNHRCYECALNYEQGNMGEQKEWLRMAIKALEQTTWIPVKFRPLTDEEQEEYPDYCYMADCQMPDDGEEILVSTKYGTVEKDVCEIDDGYSLDSGYDWQDDVTAWMPLPESYKGE